jgi:prepilin-type processing-associated H-X9-DG protein
MGGVINFMPPYANPSGLNVQVSKLGIPGFLCPSDGGPFDSAWPGQNNYAANQGTWLCDRGDSAGGPNDIAPSETSQGILYFLSRIRLRDVTDGTSQTTMFSEVLLGRGSPNPRYDMFVMTNQTSLDATYQTCSSTNVATATPLTSKWGWSWVMGENCCTLYNHVSQPNTIKCAGLPFPGTMTNMSMQVPPSSEHPGGVNVLMVDGSTRNVPNVVDLVVWRGMGTRNGREVIDLPGAAN